MMNDKTKLVKEAKND